MNAEHILSMYDTYLQHENYYPAFGYPYSCEITNTGAFMSLMVKELVNAV